VSVANITRSITSVVDQGVDIESTWNVTDRITEILFPMTQFLPQSQVNLLGFKPRPSRQEAGTQPPRTWHDHMHMFLIFYCHSYFVCTLHWLLHNWYSCWCEIGSFFGSGG